MLLPASTCYMPKKRFGLYDIEITQLLVWVVCTLQRYHPPAEGGKLEECRVLWHQSNSGAEDDRYNRSNTGRDWCDYEREVKESWNGQRTVSNHMSMQQVLAVLHFQRTVRCYDKEQVASLRAWTQPGSTGARIYQNFCRAKAQANRFWGPIVPKYGLPIDTSQEVQLSTADLVMVEERYRNERDEHKRFILRSFLPSEVQARYKDEPLVKFLPEHRTTN